MLIPGINQDGWQSEDYQEDENIEDSGTKPVFINHEINSLNKNPGTAQVNGQGLANFSFFEFFKPGCIFHLAV